MKTNSRKQKEEDQLDEILKENPYFFLKKPSNIG